MSGGVSLLSISSALFAYSRREGPIGSVVNIGPVATIRPISPNLLAASCTIALGVRFADNGRFEPSASA